MSLIVSAFDDFDMIISLNCKFGIPTDVRKNGGFRILLDSSVLVERYCIDCWRIIEIKETGKEIVGEICTFEEVLKLTTDDDKIILLRNIDFIEGITIETFTNKITDVSLIDFIIWNFDKITEENNV